MTVALRTVLVANRGEIALRIIRGCRDAGLTSVAVHAAIDADAPYVAAADRAVALDGDTPATTYLDVGQLLGAARATESDAVHPGYGWLSEDADFAQAVVDAGLTWIGPPPAAIRLLGDKVSARTLAAKVGAPLLAGSDGPVSGPAEVEAFARDHGLPLAIKAAFGGGGRGLRVVREVGEIASLLDAARRESARAFGRDECFVERWLDRARHVEAQVLADVHGAVVVVGTRDCSLQRRHQKLVEEAPAPDLTAEQGHLIRTAAKDVCREAGYVGAGTVEFLLGEDGTVAMLEVNTRLQVEHTVTEETTGVDLVREQFRLAAGEHLRFDGDLDSRGHALELRINSEDPGSGFIPASGTITRYEPPSGPGVRVDSGVTLGTVVSGAYDSLLAKIIVRGETRTEALERARRALAETHIEGVPTTLPFHRAVLRDPAFTGRLQVHTRWIEGVLGADPLAFGAPWAGPSPAGPDTPGSNRAVIEIGGRPMEVDLPGAAGLGLAVGYDNAGAAGFSVGDDDGTGLPAGEGDGTGLPAGDGGDAGGAAPGGRGGPGGRRGPGGRGGLGGRRRSRAALPGGDEIVTPMQGTVVTVVVAEGDTVQAGGLLATVEAMKMEHRLVAPHAGVVRDLAVRPGDALAQGSPVCRVVAADSTGVAADA
jgi:acetyl-CoA/propionyl-CoA carboxylase biotin carboxyl carrier protein